MPRRVPMGVRFGIGPLFSPQMLFTRRQPDLKLLFLIHGWQRSLKFKLWPSPNVLPWIYCTTTYYTYAAVLSWTGCAEFLVGNNSRFLSFHNMRITHTVEILQLYIYIYIFLWAFEILRQSDHSEKLSSIFHNFRIQWMIVLSKFEFLPIYFPSITRKMTNWAKTSLLMVKSRAKI